MGIRTLAYLALIGSLSISVAPAQPRAAELAPVIVGSVGSGAATNWPTYVAMSRGYFKDEGLAVTMIGIPASSSVQQQLAAGSINIGTGGTVDPLRAIDKGAPITLLRIEVGKAPYYIFAKPSIHTMAELKGKMLSIDRPKEIAYYYFERMAAGEGLNIADCNFVYAGSTAARLAALLSGSVDATMLLPPLTFVAQSKGYRELPIPPDFDKGLPFTGFAIDLNWGESHKPLVRKFLDAYAKGVAWLYDTAHKKEAVDILLGQAKVTRSDAEKTYDIYVKAKIFVAKATIKKDDLQDEIDLLKKDGSISGPADFSRFYKPELLGLSK